METNSKKVLAALPDFQDYMQLAEEIKRLSLEKMLTENTIRAREAEAFQKVMTDSKFFVNGKPVSVSFFDNAFKFAGIDGNLLTLREHLADMVSELELKRSQFEVYGKMHDLFKTLVYQEKIMA
jgi:hypothetical protein